MKKRLSTTFWNELSSLKYPFVVTKKIPWKCNSNTENKQEKNEREFTEIWKGMEEKDKLTKVQDA